MKTFAPLLAISCLFAAAGTRAANPGDSVFAGLQNHTINIRFSQPDYVAQLTANKEAEISIPAQVIVDGVVYDSVGVRYKGNSSYSAPNNKKSFRITLDEYGKTKKWDGMKGFVLDNAYLDPSFLREKIHLDFCRQAGIPAPRANFAQVSINDTAFAYYSLVELADKRFLDTHYGEDQGDLFKARDGFGQTQPSALSYFQRLSPYGITAYAGPPKYYYEYKSDDSVRAWTRMANFIDTLNLSASPAVSLPRIADVNALYRAFGTDILFANLDSYMSTGQNFYVYFPVAADSKMRWIVWDVSLTLNGMSGFGSIFASGDGTTTSLTYTSGNSDRPLINKIMNTPSLKADYLRALYFLYKDYFAGAGISQHIDSVAAFVRPYVVADTRKQYPNINSFDSSLALIKTFMTKRQTYVEGGSGFLASGNNITAETAIRSGDIVINEVAAGQGWAELYNNRQYAIDLSGHFLSDSASHPAKWAFPANSVIQPGGYLKVRIAAVDSSVGLRASFTVPSSGGHLRLSRASGSVVDSITFGAQTNRSLARIPDGTGPFVLARPTAEAANSADSTPVAASIPIAPGAVVINEFMADNDSILGPLGTAEDWVELYNTTPQPIDLGGRLFSDNISSPAKWVFPANTVVAGKGYLVVWADGKTGAGVHATWSLSKSGEQIRLSNADSSVIDSLSFGAQATNLSMARIPNGSGPFVQGPATLGTENVAVVGLARGFAPSAQALALSFAGVTSPLTIIRFSLAAPSSVSLAVFDSRGREVAKLLDGERPAGQQVLLFDAKGLSAGAYYFRLRAGAKVQVRTRIFTP